MCGRWWASGGSRGVRTRHGAPAVRGDRATQSSWTVSPACHSSPTGALLPPVHLHSAPRCLQPPTNTSCTPLIEPQSPIENPIETHRTPGTRLKPLLNVSRCRCRRDAVADTVRYHDVSLCAAQGAESYVSLMRHRQAAMPQRLPGLNIRVLNRLPTQPGTLVVRCALSLSLTASPLGVASPHHTRTGCMGYGTGREARTSVHEREEPFPSACVVVSHPREAHPPSRRAGVC